MTPLPTFTHRFRIIATGYVFAAPDVPARTIGDARRQALRFARAFRLDYLGTAAD